MERSAAGQKSHIFLDKTALQDTGQYGWQRFRKPLLYPGKQMDAGTKDVSPTGIDRQFSHLPAGLNNQGLIEAKERSNQREATMALETSTLPDSPNGAAR